MTDDPADPPNDEPPADREPPTLRSVQLPAPARDAARVTPEIVLALVVAAAIGGATIAVWRAGEAPDEHPIASMPAPHRVEGGGERVPPVSPEEERRCAESVRTERARVAEAHAFNRAAIDAALTEARLTPVPLHTVRGREPPPASAKPREPPAAWLAEEELSSGERADPVDATLEERFSQDENRPFRTFALDAAGAIVSYELEQRTARTETFWRCACEPRSVPDGAAPFEVRRLYWLNRPYAGERTVPVDVVSLQTAYTQGTCPDEGGAPPP